MKVGDYIIKPIGGRYVHIWRVVGIYYGASGHQDMVGLAVINGKAGNAGDQDVEEMLTPLELVKPYLAETAQ